MNAASGHHIKMTKGFCALSKNRNLCGFPLYMIKKKPDSKDEKDEKTMIKFE